LGVTTGLFTHAACLAHEPPAGHPERPARLSEILEALKSVPLAARNAPQASLEALKRTHSSMLVHKVLEKWPEEARRAGCARIDSDTFMSTGSAEAALRAAGAVMAAVDGVMAGEFRNAFCAVRPPGHHAERDRAMGFCLFNNVAVGALYARSTYGLSRIAVLDFDVHHGNGTQDIAFDDPNFFYGSTHQAPLYPGTGDENERGVCGNVVNHPLQPGSAGPEFRAAWRGRIFPALEAFAPQFIFLSAGFDAHRADPLANLNLTKADFAWITAELCRIADRLCGGRVVSALEGGYELEALAASALAHVRALTEA
jgi:acetoin utilization deacetylase AcuC-like enzyme